MLNKIRLKQSTNAVLFGIFFSSLLASSSVVAAEVNADSSIKAVTVYPGSAKVMRVSNIALTVGNNEVVINNLPINLNESSLRVSGEGQGAFTLGSVELFRNIKLDVVQQREKELREKIEDVQASRKETEDALNRNLSQLEYIKKMVLGNNSGYKVAKETNDYNIGTYTNLPLDQWQQAWQTLDQATAAVQEKIRIAEKELKNSDKQLNKLTRELQQVATNQKETRSARLQVEAASTGELTLNLSYQINGARWEPVYDADLNTETGEIQFKTLAQISQRTGEDWQGVDVTLSTLRPSAGTQLPELNSWVLDFMPEPMPMAEASSGMFNREITMDSMVAMAPAPRAMKAAPKPMRQQESRLISTDFSAEYQVPGSISLDSGSNKRRFALTSEKLVSKLKLASAPRFDPRAMLLATTQYQQETPLIAGSMSLYRNGSFVGNSFLSQKLSGEEIKLSFGEDDKVKIKFLPDPDKKRQDGLLFGKKKVVERHYKVSANSQHDKPYELSLYDVIPVSSQEDIVVKSIGDMPTKTDLDDKKGVVSWDVSLEPKKSFNLKYGYSVSYPEDKVVPGL